MAKWTNEECQILIDNYQYLGCDCCKLINRSKKQINRKAILLGLKVGKERKEYLNSKKGFYPRNIKYKLSKDNFDLNDKYVSYILGFIWADGYFNEKINRIDICIQKNDGDELNKIFTKIGDWSYYERFRKNRKPQSGFCAKNKSIGEFFRKYNYHNKSTSEPEILDTLSDENQRYWWLGFFDGDGCCYYDGKYTRQISISGTFDYKWKYFDKLSKEIGIKYSLSNIEGKSGNKHSSVRFTGKNSIINFYNYIYLDDEIGLSRKREKFNKIIESYKK